MSDEAGNSTKESSPSSSTDTKLGPIGGEREPLVRNREPLASTHPHPAAHHRRRQLPAPTHTRLHATTALIARSVCSGDVQDRAVRTVEAGTLQLRRGLPGGPYRSPDSHPHPHPHQQFAHGEHELLVRSRPAKCAAPLRIPQACHVPRKRGLTAPLLDSQVQDHRVSELRQRQVPVRSQVQLHPRQRAADDAVLRPLCRVPSM